MLLISGHYGNHVVRGLYQSIYYLIICTDGSVGGNDIVVSHVLIKRFNSVKEFRGTVDVTVGQPGFSQIHHILLNVFSCHSQEFFYGKGIDAGLCQIVFASCFPFVHPLFHFKGLDLHVSPP